MSVAPIMQCLFKNGAKAAVVKTEHSEEGTGSGSTDGTGIDSTIVTGIGSTVVTGIGSTVVTGTAFRPFSCDKAQYNKFNYKLKLVPQEMQVAWAIVRSQEKVNPQGFAKFVQQVIAYDVVDNTRKKRSIVNSEGTVEEVGWVAWAEAERTEGHDVLLAMVKAGMVDSRPHPRLPPGHAIPWPQSLQIRKISEKEVRKKTKVDTHESEVATTEEQASDSFDTAWASALTPKEASAPSVTSSLPSINSSLPEGMAASSVMPSADEVRDKACVSHLRKAHNAWDRSKREFESVLMQSAQHVNTKGCKFEDTLKSLLTKGDGIDGDLRALEQKYMRNERFSQEEVEGSAAMSNDIKAIIKEGNKIAVAMKPWFRM
jgi:hypothetical protein